MDAITKEELKTMKGLIKRAADALSSLTQAKGELEYDADSNELAVMRTNPDTFDEAIETQAALAEVLKGPRKIIPKGDRSKRLGRVELKISYVVDLDDQYMIDRAIEALGSDAFTAVRFREIDDKVDIIEDPNLTEAEIPSFLLEEEKLEAFLAEPGDFAEVLIGDFSAEDLEKAA